MTVLSTWAEVVVGNTLQGKDGHAWKVIDERDGWVLLRLHGAMTHQSIPRPPADRLVTVLGPDLGAAVETAQHVLGAVVLSGRPQVMPPFP